MNSAQLPLEVVVRKDEESETRGCGGVKACFCLSVWNTKVR
jgi:hypothetical protein